MTAAAPAPASPVDITPVETNAFEGDWRPGNHPIKGRGTCAARGPA